MYLYVTGSGGDSGDSVKGNEHVTDLVAKGVMKEWLQDGQRMCCYRQISVGREEGVEVSSSTTKASCVISPHIIFV